MALFTIDEVNDPERLHLENRFDDVISGLWCEEEKERLFRMKPEVLENISNAELKERLDQFDEVYSNIELVEKYMTITLTDTMVEAEDNGKTDLEEWLLSATGDLYELFKNMNKCLNETGRLIPLQDDELDIMLFKNPKSIKLQELENNLFSFQLESPWFGCLQKRNFNLISKPSSIFKQTSENAINTMIDTEPNPVTNNTSEPNEYESLNESDDYSYSDGDEYFCNLNTDDLLKLKEYNYHLKYLQLLKEFYWKLDHAKILTNMTPKINYCDLQFKMHSAPMVTCLDAVLDFETCKFRRTSSPFKIKLKTSLSKNKNSRKIGFFSPYTRKAIQNEFDTLFLRGSDINISPKSITWYKFVNTFVFSIKLSIIQTLKREFLSVFRFPTLIWLKNNLTDDMCVHIDDYLHTRSLLENSLKKTVAKIAILKSHMEFQAENEF